MKKAFLLWSAVAVLGSIAALPFAYAQAAETASSTSPVSECLALASNLRDGSGLAKVIGCFQKEIQDLLAKVQDLAGKIGAGSNFPMPSLSPIALPSISPLPWSFASTTQRWDSDGMGGGWGWGSASSTHEGMREWLSSSTIPWEAFSSSTMPERGGKDGWFASGTKPWDSMPGWEVASTTAQYHEGCFSGMLSLNGNDLIPCPNGANWQNMSFGSQGDAVKGIQDLLREQGLFTASSTGFFGSMTQDAVKKFQSHRGLGSTGVVDVQTLSKLADRLGGLMGGSGSTGRFGSSGF
jgi:hypothetical protein